MSRSPAVLTLLAAVSLAIALDVPSAQAARAAMTDAEVLGIYIQVNGFDIETALLARAKANTNTVRSLATHVSTDHMGVRQAAYDLAAKCKVTPTLPSSRSSAAIEHGQALTKLAALSGAEFDKAYLEHDVAFHRAAIDAVKQVLLPSSTCPALKAHFNTVLPAFEQHLSQTETLTRELTTR